MTLITKTPKGRRFRRRKQREKTKFAILGYGDGRPIAQGAGLGKVWIRFPAGADADTNTVFTPPTTVNCGVTDYFQKEGLGVRVGYDEHGDLTIKRADERDARDSELDLRYLKNGTPENKWLYFRNFWPFKAQAVGSGTLVTVHSLFYQDNFGDLNHFIGTQKQADKIDLASFIPTTGNHRVVALFLRSITNTIQVTGSTTQAISSALDLTDLQECFTAADANTIPIQSFILQDGQTTIDETDAYIDLRQFINAPQRLGKMDFVEEKTFSSAATTTTFSGLTGTDMYKMEVAIAEGSGVGDTNFETRINGDVNSTDYSYEQIVARGTSITAATQANVAYLFFARNGDDMFATADFQLVNGRFFAKSLEASWDANDTVEFVHRMTAKNTAGVGSISQIEIIASNANGIGIGSVFRLYKVTE